MSLSPIPRIEKPLAPLTVHVVERMAPGGIETLVLDMVRGLPGRHAVFSLSGDATGLVDAWPRLSRLGETLEAFDKQPGISASLVARLARRLRTLAPQAVVLHHVGPLIYGGLAARLARVPSIVHVEHDAWHYDSPRRRAVARLVFNVVRPTRVAVSEQIAAKLRQHFSNPAVTVIAPGIDMDLYRPRDRAAARVRLGLRQDVPLIGTSGRLVAVKSQATLIDALATLRKAGGTFASAELVIVGDGPERVALATCTSEHGLETAVHLLGHRDDMAEILPAFDVYALPSLNEGLPRSVLEAQASGLAVVASDVGALAQAVCPRSGRLVPAGDAAALATALADRLAARADPTIPRGFVAERFALTQTLAAFDQLLTRHGIPC